MVAPRDRLLDGLSNWPRVRKTIQRLPPRLRPGPKRHSQIIAIDESGAVVENLHAAAVRHSAISSVLETARYLWLGSVTAPRLARLDRAAAGL